MSVVSERALREIYLKPFELCVKEGKVTSLMNSYNPINEYWTSNSYELNTTILRGEWGYTGMVMTDWWPKLRKEENETLNLCDMAAAQCDVYMLSGNAASLESNLEQGLESGVIKRGQLQRNAANLLNYIMHTHTFARFVENGGKFESSLRYKMDELETVFEYSEPKTAEKIVVRYGGTGRYLLCVDYLANVPELSQLIISVVIDGEINAGMTVNGTDGKKERAYFDFTAQGAEGNIKISFPPLISVEKICIMR